MQQKISPGLVAAIIIVVVGIAAFFGWRTMSGGPNGDVTNQTIQHWQDAKNAAMSHKPTSREEAAKMGAPVGGGAPMGAAPMSGPPR
jgi:hypothetical protein